MTIDLRSSWRGLVPAIMLAFAAPAFAGAEDDANAGLDAIKAGNYAQAVQLFTRAIASGQLPPDEREYAYVQRGTAYLDQGNKAAAALDFAHALKLKPGDQDARDGLAQAHETHPGGGQRGSGGNPTQLAQAGLKALNDGDAARAIGLFSQAIASGRMTKDDLELAYLSRGQAYSKQGDYGHATADIDYALQLKADDADAQSALVETLGKVPAPSPTPAIDAGGCKKNMTSQGSTGGLGGMFLSSLAAPNAGQSTKTFTTYLDYQGLDRVSAMAGLYRAVTRNSPSPGTDWQLDSVSLHNGFLSAEVTPPGSNALIKLEATVQFSGPGARVTLKETMTGPALLVDIRGSMCRTLTGLVR